MVDLKSRLNDYYEKLESEIELNIHNRYDPQVLRFLLFSSHQDKLHVNEEKMDVASSTLNYLRMIIERIKINLNKTTKIPLEYDHSWLETIQLYKNSIRNYLQDDLDTVIVISHLLELTKHANRYLRINKQSNVVLDSFLKIYDETFEILGLNIESMNTLDPQIENLLQLRNKARKENNTKLVDKLKQQLLDLGVNIEDTAHGVKWKLV